MAAPVPTEKVEKQPVKQDLGSSTGLSALPDNHAQRQTFATPSLIYDASDLSKFFLLSRLFTSILFAATSTSEKDHNTPKKGILPASEQWFHEMNACLTWNLRIGAKVWSSLSAGPHSLLLSTRAVLVAWKEDRWTQAVKVKQRRR